MMKLLRPKIKDLKVVMEFVDIDDTYIIQIPTTDVDTINRSNSHLVQKYTQENHLPKRTGVVINYNPAFINTPNVFFEVPSRLANSFRTFKLYQNKEGDKYLEFEPSRHFITQYDEFKDNNALQDGEFIGVALVSDLVVEFADIIKAIKKYPKRFVYDTDLINSTTSKPTLIDDGVLDVMSLVPPGNIYSTDVKPTSKFRELLYYLLTNNNYSYRRRNTVDSFLGDMYTNINTMSAYDKESYLRKLKE